MLVLAMPAAAPAAGTPSDPFNGRRSYSSSHMDCLVANDAHAVHFSSMQQARWNGGYSFFTNYCQELPAVGRTFLSIDLLDRDVRTTPVALRVVEEAYPRNGQGPREKSTLLEVPARIYRTGTAETAVEISRPGHYALIATIGGKVISGDERLRIPFSVAVPPPTRLGPRYRDFAAGLALTFFAAMSLIGYRAYRAYNPKTMPGTAAPFAWPAPRRQKKT